MERVGFEEIAGHRLNLIHISFEDNQMTLRVPVAQARAAGLRKLASQEALAAVLATLKGRPRVSRLMWAKRSQEYLAKINTGELAALAEVVRDLQAAGDGSGSSFSQRNLFELALDRLAGEFAAVRRIAKPDAVELLNQALVEARADSAIGAAGGRRRVIRENCLAKHATAPICQRRRFSAWVYRTLPMRPRRSSVLPI